jgi:penicillin-binding protein 1C
MPRYLRYLLPIALVGLAFVAGFYGYVLHGLPSVADVSAGLALPSTKILDRHGELLYEITPNRTARNTVLGLDDFPRHCVNALVATEDAEYYRHRGVSVRGVARALWINLRGGDILAGGSTITQQVARNLLLDPHTRAERTLRRKLREMVLAMQLERVYSKDEILALWLNQTDFGNLAYGLDAAAQAYFGAEASRLSLAQCALLIGIPQAPPYYDPLTNYDNAKARQGTVLRLMTEQGYIDAFDADVAVNEPLQFAAATYPIRAPHAVLEVWKQIEERYPDALYSSGLVVHTTIDLNLTEEVQTIVRGQLAKLNDAETGNRIPVQANNAAVVIMEPHTGEVRVMLGSPDYFDDDISGAVNLAVQPRQPGSTLKPFTYALAMNPDADTTWTAATMLIDVRTPFITRRLESYVPANFDFVEHGPVSVREALASSYNIPAVIALEHVGVQPFIQFMTHLGVSKLSENADVDLSVTLGGGEVRLINLTGAYAALANGGNRVTPTLIRQVDTFDGETLYTYYPQRGQQVIDERVAFVITDILSDDRARVPSFGQNSVLNVGRPAAAKTGTTTDFRDNWVMGYTPDLVVGVWVGNADYSPMLQATGITGAGPIWHHTMRAAHKALPEREFSVPDGVTRVTVCSTSGDLPTGYCPHTRREWFLVGTEPTEPDTLYQPFILDTRTGTLADESTPPEFQREQAFMVLPPEAREWGRMNGIAEPPTPIVRADETYRIRRPDPYTLYELSPTLPRDRQQIRITAALPADTVRVDYMLNGESLTSVTAAPFEAWWTLEIGDFTLEAVVTRANGEQVTLEPVPFGVQDFPQLYMGGG